MTCMGAAYMLVAVCSCIEAGLRPENKNARKIFARFEASRT